MSKPPRCHECKHRPGPRVLVYSKRRGGTKMLDDRKQHKKPCGCECHARAGVSA